MAATAATPDLAVKSENVQFQRWSKVTMKDDDPTKVADVKVAIVSNPSDEETKDLTTKGYVLEFTQTVRVDKAGTVDGMSAIIRDDEERIVVFNRGLASKLNQKLNSLFKDTDDSGKATFQSTEDIYDTSDLVNEPTQKRSLSPFEKAIKGLEKAGLSQDVLNAMIASLQAAQQGS